MALIFLLRLSLTSTLKQLYFVKSSSFKSLVDTVTSNFIAVQIDGTFLHRKS